MKSRTLFECLLGVLVLLFAVSYWREHQAHMDAAQLLARAITDTAVAKRARVDTLRLKAETVAVASRASVRTFRDTLKVTDTLEVKRFVLRVDTALVHDSIAIARADTVIAADHAVESALRTELALALAPHPSPRLAITATALVDPAGLVPVVSASVGFRVIGNLSVVAVGFERVSLGSVPGIYVGFSVRL